MNTRKPKMRSVCKLCLRERELLRSHIMPRSMYKAASHAAEPTETNLIQVDHSRNTAVRTSKQLVEKMLCEECEKTLEAGGENYFARICFQGQQGFPLREKLKSIEANDVIQGKRVWLESNSEKALKTSRIKHFISGILWRHSVCTLGGFAQAYQRALGETYSKQFRSFLLGNSEFPKLAKVLVYVDDNAENASFLSHPTCQREDLLGLSIKTHSFILPGVRIRTLVGGPVEKFNAVYSSSIVFFEWDSRRTDFAKDLAQKLRSTTLKGKLRSEFSGK